MKPIEIEQTFAIKDFPIHTSPHLHLFISIRLENDCRFEVTKDNESDAYVFGQNANSGRFTKIGTTQAPSACGGLPSHLTKPLIYVF